MLKKGDRVILTGSSNIESKPVNFGKKGLLVSISEITHDNYWYRVKWDEEYPGQTSEISWVGNCLELDTQFIRDNKLKEIGI